MASRKLKEYVLRIIYDTESGEIHYLSEYVDMGYSLDIDGESVLIPPEMATMLDEETDSSELGIT